MCGDIVGSMARRAEERVETLARDTIGQRRRNATHPVRGADTIQPFIYPASLADQEDNAMTSGATDQSELDQLLAEILGDQMVIRPCRLPTVHFRGML